MPHICKNCGARYKGNYCNQCGQRAKVGRLTLRSVIDNWAYGLTNCDRGILFTFKELFIRPGHMLADYVSGKRIIHFQPFPMLFITAGFYGLMSQILLPAKPVEAVQTVTDLTFWERFFNLLEQWIDSSMSLTAIVTLPFFAWASRLAFYTPPFHPYGPGTRKGLSAWMYPASKETLLQLYPFGLPVYCHLPCTLPLPNPEKIYLQFHRIYIHICLHSMPTVDFSFIHSLTDYGLHPYNGTDR